ncbi:MAG TPA: hypothetical protein VJA23_06340 [Candidatus Nanoarchaeia archaeon]|nr:hypothetical protein [Candidatus Nanoarchaeia archaeon]
MISRKAWTILNFSLFLVALVLALNLWGVDFPSTGKAAAEQLETDSFCVMRNWESKFVEREVKDCCLEIKRVVVGCKSEQLYYMDKTLQWKCFTGNKIEYYFNQAGYKYCKRLTE